MSSEALVLYVQCFCLEIRLDNLSGRNSSFVHLLGVFPFVLLFSSVDGCNLTPLCLNASHLQPLPGKRSPQEVHEHIAQRLEVITSALLNAQVCVYRCIAGSACETLVLTVRDVDVGLWVTVLLHREDRMTNSRVNSLLIFARVSWESCCPHCCRVAKELLRLAFVMCVRNWGT